MRTFIRAGLIGLVIYSQIALALPDVKPRPAGLGLSQVEQDEISRIGEENGELSAGIDRLQREKELTEKEDKVFRQLKEEFTKQMGLWSTKEMQPRATIGMSNKRKSESPEDLNQPAEALKLTEWVTVLEGVTSGVARSIAVASKKESAANGASFEIELDPRNAAEKELAASGFFKLVIPNGSDPFILQDQRKKTADMLSADLTFTSAETLARLIFPEPGSAPKEPALAPSAPIAIPPAASHPGEAEATPVPVEEPVATKFEYVPVATEVNDFLKQQMLVAKQAADNFDKEREQLKENGPGENPLADSGNGGAGSGQPTPSESPTANKGGGSGGGGGGAPGGGEGGGGGGNGGPPLGGVAAPGITMGGFGNLAMAPVEGAFPRLPGEGRGLAPLDVHPVKNTIPELFKTAAKQFADGATNLANKAAESVKDWMKSAAGSSGGTGAGAAPPEALASAPENGPGMGAPRGASDGGGDLGAGLGPTFEGGGGAPTAIEVAYQSGGSSVDGGAEIGMKNAAKESDLPSQIANLRAGASREISSVGAPKQSEGAIFQLARDKFKGLKLERRPVKLIDEQAV